MRRFSALLAVALVVLAPRFAPAQPLAVRRVAPREVPAGVPFDGKVEAARRWADRTGDNLLLLSRTDEIEGTDDVGNDARSREIYAYHYVREGSGYRLLWRTVDFVRDCIVDITLEFVPGSLQVTDLDRDGVAETSYVYRLACRGGVDPADMKLIMHEGATKYAIRGFTDMRHLGGDYPAPEMRIDPALERAPAFRAAAVRQWNRFVREMAGPEEGAP